MIELKQLRGVIESLLFCSDESLSVEKISEITGQEISTIKDTVIQMQSDYLEDNRGFVLKEAAGGYRLFTNPSNDEYVRKFVLSSDMRKLTNAALETLAIVVYKQPVTRAEVNYIRGVNSEGSLNTLISRGLVKEAGRRKVAGNPIIYSTTKKFLELAGLNSIKDLPNLKDFAPDEATKEQINQSLKDTPPVETINAQPFTGNEE